MSQRLQALPSETAPRPNKQEDTDGDEEDDAHLKTNSVGSRWFYQARVNESAQGAEDLSRKCEIASKAPYSTQSASTLARRYCYGCKSLKSAL